MLVRLMEIALLWGMRGCLAWYVAHEYALVVNEKLGYVAYALDVLN